MRNIKFVLLTMSLFVFAVPALGGPVSFHGVDGSLDSGVFCNPVQKLFPGSGEGLASVVFTGGSNCNIKSMQDSRKRSRERLQWSRLAGALSV